MIHLIAWLKGMHEQHCMIQRLFCFPLISYSVILWQLFHHFLMIHCTRHQFSNASIYLLLFFSRWLHMCIKIQLQSRTCFHTGSFGNPKPYRNQNLTKHSQYLKTFRYHKVHYPCSLNLKLVIEFQFHSPNLIYIYMYIHVIY